MAEPLVNLGERIVRAAGLAVMVHLYESAALQPNDVQVGTDGVREDALTTVSACALRRRFKAEKGAE